MTDQSPAVAVSVEDFTVDDEGRVIVENPQIAQMISAAAAPEKAQAAATNNCHGGNCAAGCGVKPK